MTRSEGEVHLHKLDHHIRADLDASSRRALGVLRPLRLVVANLPEAHYEEVEAKVGGPYCLWWAEVVLHLDGWVSALGGRRLSCGPWLVLCLYAALPGSWLLQPHRPATNCTAPPPSRPPRSTSLAAARRVTRCPSPRWST